MEGVLLRQTNGLRVVLSLTNIMRSFSVEVDATDLEPLALLNSPCAPRCASPRFKHHQTFPGLWLKSMIRAYALKSRKHLFGANCNATFLVRIMIVGALFTPDTSCGSGPVASCRQPKFDGKFVFNCIGYDPRRLSSWRGRCLKCLRRGCAGVFPPISREQRRHGYGTNAAATDISRGTHFGAVLRSHGTGTESFWARQQSSRQHFRRPVPVACGRDHRRSKAAASVSALHWYDVAGHDLPGGRIS